MSKMKARKKYYFSVEGETESWYLKWLEALINKNEASKLNVTLNCYVEKNPFKIAKSLLITSKTEIYHLSDYESDEPGHVIEFLETIANLKKAKESGKDLKYHFGYTNLTFDLWIILHKCECNGSYTYRKQYISVLNKAFGENFESMTEYKEEVKFKRLLSNLLLEDIINAINRSKLIMKRNSTNGYPLYEYKGYHYYKENPSLEIWRPIEKILKDCGLL